MKLGECGSGAEVHTTRSHPHKVGLDPKEIDRLAQQYGAFAEHILKSQRPSTFTVGRKLLRTGLAKETYCRGKRDLL
jgi:hypothetical protein